MSTDWNLPEVAQHYEEYDAIRERAFAYPLMFAEIGLSRPDCKRVLDYGCGTGKVAERIVQGYAVEVVAADPSPGMLGIARKKRAHTAISYQQLADDQKLDLPDASIDAALSCFICVCISEADRIRAILREVQRVLRPGARYAMLELNPEALGIPFHIALMGEAGKVYQPGDPVEVHLATPGGEPMVIIDYYWPKKVHCDFFIEAGFRKVTVHTPTLPEGYQGPDAALMEVERTHAPYAIYLAEK